MHTATVVGLLLGLLFAGVGGWVHWRAMSFYKTALCTQGQVVDLVQRAPAGAADPDQRESYSHPVVSFAPRADCTVRFQSAVGSRPPAYRIGDIVRVVFRPANPQDARIDDFWGRWVGALLCAVGVLIIALMLGIEFGIVPYRIRYGVPSFR